MNDRHLRLNLRWLVRASLLLTLGGCAAGNVIVPDQRARPDRRSADAVGFVTVSPPLFTPLDDVVGGDKRLQFGDMRKESVIARRLEQPSFGSDEVRYSLLEAAIAARLAGARVSVIDRKTTGTDGALDANGKPIVPGQSQERTQTFDTPEVPGAPTLPTVPDKVLDKLVALLERSDQRYSLPPDELATLVAANKTYMVNLEEYYNVEGFDFKRGLDQAYVPYKMHFTVTAEPGWYSRYNQYDAVVELSCTLGDYLEEGKESSCAALNKKLRKTRDADSPPDMIFLSVSPLETAQTVREFTSRLSQVAMAAEAEGVLSQSLAVRGQVRSLVATAQRLEGLRAQKTLTVAYPATNRVRIRFQAPRAAIPQGRDLQARSRVLTAIVLVRNRLAGNAYSIAKRARFVADLSAHVKVEKQFCVRVKRAYNQLSAALAGNGLAGMAPRLSYWRDGVLDLSKASLPLVPTEPLDLRRALHAKIFPGESAASDLEDTLLARESLLRLKAKSLLEGGPLVGGGSKQEFGSSEAEKELASSYKDWLDAVTGVEASRKSVDAARADYQRAFRLSDDAGKPPPNAGGAAKKPGPSDSPGELVKETCEERIARLEREVSQHRQGLRCVLHGRPCKLAVDGYFSATAWDARGRWNPPRNLLIGTSRSADRLCARERGDCADQYCCHACTPIEPLETWIPAWLGPFNIKLAIQEAAGHYTLPLSELAQTTQTLAAAQAKLASAAGAVKKAEAALAAQERSMAAEAKVLAVARLNVPRSRKLLDAAIAAGKPKEAIKKLRKILEADRDALERAIRAAPQIQGAFEHLAESSTKKEAAQGAVKAAVLGVGGSRQAAVAGGRAVVALTVDSPPFFVDREHSIPVGTKVFARVLGLTRESTIVAPPPGGNPLDSYEAGRFFEIPAGGRNAALLEFGGIDMSLATSGTSSANPVLRPMRAWVEVVLVPDQTDPNTPGKFARPIQTVVASVRLEPRELVSPSPPAKKSSSAGAKPIEVQLRDLILKFSSDKSKGAAGVK